MRAALLLVLAAGTGCATFVGIEDAEQHLPRLDGDYVIAISRVRNDPPANTRDTILMRGRATLDTDSRTLDLSVGILEAGGGAALTETSLTNIEFPDDSDEVEYTINLSIPDMALPPTPPPSTDDLTINTPVRFIAEADYSFCAKALAGEREVTLGSRLVADLTMLPPADGDCDDPLRQ